jgi:hypothetical protein
MELELIEPYLFMDFEHAAAGRMVEAFETLQARTAAMA